MGMKKDVGSELREIMHVVSRLFQDTFSDRHLGLIVSDELTFLRSDIQKSKSIWLFKVLKNRRFRSKFTRWKMCLSWNSFFHSYVKFEEADWSPAKRRAVWQAGHKSPSENTKSSTNDGNQWKMPVWTELEWLRNDLRRVYLSSCPPSHKFRLIL